MNILLLFIIYLFIIYSVDLDRAVDRPHEPPARDEADGAGDQEEEKRHDPHVAEVEQARDETDQVELCTELVSA